MSEKNSNIITGWGITLIVFISIAAGMFLGLTIGSTIITQDNNDYYDKAFYNGYDLRSTMYKYNVLDTSWCPDCYLIYTRDSGYTTETWDSIFKETK